MAAQAAIHDKAQQGDRVNWISMMPYWQPKEPCAYILASERDGILYTGVTSAIHDRMMRNRSGADEGFTKRYKVHRLVYCEYHPNMDDAILRESRIKKWNRAWKIRLIQSVNPEWIDLFDPEAGVQITPVDAARMNW